MGCLRDGTSLVPAHVDIFCTRPVAHGAGFRDAGRALHTVPWKLGIYQPTKQYLQPECVLFQSGSTDDDVAQVEAGTRN